MATMNERQLVQDICYMISFDQLTDVDVKASLMSITDRGRGHWSISPLVVAVRKHRMDLVQMMILECDFDVNATVATGIDATSSSGTLFSHPDCWCPLSTAVEIENEELIRFLGVTCSANPNILNPNQTSGHRSVLQLAIAKGNPVLVKQLIDEMGADVNMALSLYDDWSKSYTALHSAMVLDIYNDNWDLMQTKILLEKGGNLNTMATWNDNCQLGIGTKTGTAIEFAFELRTHFKDRRNTEYLVTLIKLNKKIVELTNEKKNFESNNQINFQVLLVTSAEAKSCTYKQIQMKMNQKSNN